MENEIVGILNELLQTYVELEKKLNTFEAIENEVERAELMSEITSVMAAAKTTESKLFPLQQKYFESGGKFSAEMQQKVEKAKQLVANLVAKISSLEENTKTKQAQLAPYIHQGVTAMKMQTAYTKHK